MISKPNLQNPIMFDRLNNQTTITLFNKISIHLDFNQLVKLFTVSKYLYEYGTQKFDWKQWNSMRIGAGYLNTIIPLDHFKIMFTVITEYIYTHCAGHDCNIVDISFATIATKSRILSNYDAKISSIFWKRLTADI